MVYQSVEDHFESCRASRMQHMRTMSQFVHVKNWGVVDNTRACFRGEVGKVGALVPERYLDDTRERLACRLKVMCRCRCLPVLQRIASERSWDSSWARCMMCDSGEIESIEHLVLRCSAYQRQRERMFEQRSSARPLGRPCTYCLAATQRAEQRKTGRTMRSSAS